MKKQSTPELSTPNEEKLTRLINIYVNRNSTLTLDNEILKDDVELLKARISELEHKDEPSE